MYACGRLLLLSFEDDPKYSSRCRGSSCGRFLFNYYSNFDLNAPAAALAPPVAAAYSILINILSEMLL